jgi:ankyrin repeat protein
VNAKYENGFTELWWAAFKGEVEFVELLLKSGADPNLSISSGDIMDGTTPLQALASLRRRS